MVMEILIQFYKATSASTEDVEPSERFEFGLRAPFLYENFVQIVKERYESLNNFALMRTNSRDIVSQTLIPLTYENFGQLMQQQAEQCIPRDITAKIVGWTDKAPEESKSGKIQKQDVHSYSKDEDYYYLSQFATDEHIFHHKKNVETESKTSASRRTERAHACERTYPINEECANPHKARVSNVAESTNMSSHSCLENDGKGFRLQDTKHAEGPADDLKINQLDMDNYFGSGATDLPMAQPCVNQLNDESISISLLRQDAGIEVMSGKTFIRTWRLRNCGARSWPENCRLVRVGGADMVQKWRKGDKNLGLPAIQPGDEIDVSLELIAPRVPGMYVSWWQLCQENGVCVGPKLMCEIMVNKLSRSSSSSSTSSSSSSSSSSSNSGQGKCKQKRQRGRRNRRMRLHLISRRLLKKKSKLQRKVFRLKRKLKKIETKLSRISEKEKRVEKALCEIIKCENEGTISNEKREECVPEAEEVTSLPVYKRLKELGYDEEQINSTLTKFYGDFEKSLEYLVKNNG